MKIRSAEIIGPAFFLGPILLVMGLSVGLKLGQVGANHFFATVCALIRHAND